MMIFLLFFLAGKEISPIFVSQKTFVFLHSLHVLNTMAINTLKQPPTTNFHTKTNLDLKRQKTYNQQFTL